MRKFRFIFIISVLILSLALPCFATVTESSGDGFALYNGYNLSNIDSVWQDKQTFPVGCIFKNTGSAANLWIGSGFTSSSTESFYISPPVRAYLYSHGSWVQIGNYDVAQSVNYAMNPIWASVDIPALDNSVYFPASNPISLDGYSVIEWDGDTSGLVTDGEGGYQVSSYFSEPGSAYTVWSESGSLSVSDQVSSLSGQPGSWFTQFNRVLAFPEGNSAGAPSGVFFSASNNAYVQTFAYRESETEGPTGAVTGLNIITPPLGETDYIVYAGTQLQCTAQVTGTGDFNPAVTWSLSYSSSAEYYPTISETGLLSVLPGVPEQRIFITATSVADPSIYATVPVYIMPPAVSSVTITPSSVTAASGQNVQFSATVSGSNVEDSAVTWAVGGASSASTRITVDGLLLIGSDEVSPVIAVRATSNQDSSVYATALVNINVPAVVTGVTITPDDIVLNRGDMQQFTATVSGTGSFDSSVTWQITSVYSAGTSITNNGLLTVSNEQKYDYIIIKATSNADPTKSAVAYVFVEDAVSDPMNIDLSVLERLLSQIEQYTKSIQYMLSYQNWFREFDFTTGQLSTQEDYIVGFVPNFYRFMQNMEQYVGQLAYRTASGSELNSRNEFTSLWDALFNFQSFQTSAGSSLGAGVFFKDTGKIFTIFTNFNGYFDTGYGIDDLWDYFNTDHISSFLSYETAYDLNPLAVAAPSDDSDPFNMSYYWEHQNEAQAWRDKYK